MSEAPPPYEGPLVSAVEPPSVEIAHLIAGRLQADGITAFIDPPEVGTYYGQATAQVLRQPIRILVPETRLEEARKILRELEESGPDDFDEE